jgi:hypothetical protein
MLWFRGGRRELQPGAHARPRPYLNIRWSEPLRRAAQPVHVVESIAGPPADVDEMVESAKIIDRRQEPKFGVGC